MNIRSYFTAPHISLFFIGLMLILPFLFPHHPFPIQTFYIEWLAAALAYLAFIPLIKQTAWPQYQVPAIIFFPIGLLVVMAIQLALLDVAYWQHYFLVAQYFTFSALMMLIGAMLKQAVGFEKCLRAISTALLIAGILSTIVIGLDLSNIRLNGWILESKLSAVANVGQQNHLASLLALAIASLALRYINQRISIWMTWPIFTVLLTGLALTASRSAWVFVGLITIGALLFRNFQRKNQITTSSHKRLLTMLALPVLFYMLQVALPHLPTAKPIKTTTNQRLVELAQHKDSARLQLYQAAWNVYADNPLLGTGFGQMAWHDINNASRVPELKGTNSQSHNIVLQFLAETGAVGTTVLLVCVIAFILRVKSAHITPERWLWWLMLCVIGTHSMLEYPLWYMHYLALTALLIGLGDMQMYSLRRIHPQVILTMLVMLWTASLVQTMHDYRIIQRWLYQNQTVKLTDERFDEMFKQLKPIRAFSPLAIYAEAQLINTLPINRNDLADKLVIYRRLLSAYSTQAHNYNYSILLALDGQQDKAITHLKHSFMRYPKGIDKHWQHSAKIAVQGEKSLFKYVKFIEHLRDGEPLDNTSPVMMNNEQFNQPPIKPAPETTRG